MTLSIYYQAYFKHIIKCNFSSYLFKVTDEQAQCHYEQKNVKFQAGTALAGNPYQHQPNL